MKKEAKDASSGESLFESTPQIILQVSILLINFYPPSWTQILSIFSSSITLSYINIETYLESREKYSLANILKFFPLFYFASIFRLLMTIAVVLLDGTGILIIGIGLVIMLFLVSIILDKKYDLKSDENWKTQISQFCFLSFLAMTNLQDSKVAAMLRIFSFYFITCSYLFIATVFIVICNIDPSGHTIPVVPWSVHTSSIIWRYGYIL